MRSAMQLLTWLVASQAHRQAPGTSNRTVSARVRDFINLDPRVFIRTYPNVDPQKLLDQMQETLRVMHGTDTESVELTSYKSRDFAVVLYETWEQYRGPLSLPVRWREFSEALLQQYLLVEVCQAKQDKFFWLEQDNMSVRGHSMQFNSLVRYSPSVVAEMSDRVH